MVYKYVFYCINSNSYILKNFISVCSSIEHVIVHVVCELAGENSRDNYLDFTLKVINYLLRILFIF